MERLNKIYAKVYSRLINKVSRKKERSYINNINVREKRPISLFIILIIPLPLSERWAPPRYIASPRTYYALASDK